jgi:hypothetical protein
LKQQEVHIILEDDNPIFRRPYKFNEVERTLGTSLVELFNGKYASTTIMPTKKNIFGN